MSSKTRVKCNVEGLTARIEQVGKRAAKGISDAMHYYAEIMLQDAIANAPHDTGALESAIKIEQDYGGINGRLRIRVMVDPNVRYRPRSGKQTNKTVGAYALLMERYLAPYGSGRWNAQVGTLEKGPQAGGRFLTRAVKDHKQALLERARRIAARAARSAK